MTPGGPLAENLMQFAPVSLDALNEVAALQTRQDRKYIVPIEVARKVLDDVVAQAVVLDIDCVRSSRYESVYFDTQDFAMYHAAARSRPRRFKVRTRTYVESQNSVLEVKARDARGNTVKTRCDHPLGSERELTPQSRSFLDEHGTLAEVSHLLQPSLVTCYLRSTLLLSSSLSRVTLDADVECFDADTGARAALDDRVLVETKSMTGLTEVDRLLWGLHFRPLSVSKYCTGLAAVHPELRANKWNRTLRDHFGWEPVRSA